MSQSSTHRAFIVHLLCALPLGDIEKALSREWLGFFADGEEASVAAAE